jgi:hypothetical protein
VFHHHRTEGDHSLPLPQTDRVAKASTDLLQEEFMILYSVRSGATDPIINVATFS